MAGDGFWHVDYTQRIWGILRVPKAEAPTAEQAEQVAQQRLGDIVTVLDNGVNEELVIDNVRDEPHD